MANIPLLKVEIGSDPLARGYSGMSDSQVADSLNAQNRTRKLEYVAGWQIYEAVNETEFQALSTEAKKDTIREIYRLGDNIPVQAGRVKSNIMDLFGPGTTTRDNLVALAEPVASRAEELGIVGVGQLVEAVHVLKARAL